MDVNQAASDLAEPPAREGSSIMPYKTDTELPDSVRHVLPTHAQDIYRKAFNSAWDEYTDSSKRRGDESREEAAHKVAWAAVKDSYEKDEKTGKWRPKQ